MKQQYLWHPLDIGINETFINENEKYICLMRRSILSNNICISFSKHIYCILCVYNSQRPLEIINVACNK